MKTVSIHVTIGMPRPSRKWLGALALLVAFALAMSGGPAAASSVGSLEPLEQYYATEADNLEGGGQVYEDVPPSNTFFEFINRISVQGLVGGYSCGGPGEPCVPPGNRPYYRPNNDVTRAQMSKFVDQARRMPGIDITTSSDQYPLRSSTSAAYGHGVRGVGFVGVSGTSVTGAGVLGFSPSIAGVGVVAEGAGSNTTALQVFNGALRAGGSTSPVFVHTATSGNTSGWSTFINHPHSNNDPDAILIVTHNFNPGGGGGIYNAHPIGVYYSGTQWAIFNNDLAAMPINSKYNVMVIKEPILPTGQPSFGSLSNENK